ncbi:hypothetical protein CK516_38175, partial [Nostoc sp. 'Peltigera malacea cyanobiont' DB3992]
MERLLSLLANEPLVINQQVNTTMVGSIAIAYKSDVKSDVDMRSHLANLIQLASNTEVVPTTANQFKPYSAGVTTEGRQDIKTKNPSPEAEISNYSFLPLCGCVSLL